MDMEENGRKGLIQALYVPGGGAGALRPQPWRGAYCDPAETVRPWLAQAAEIWKGVKAS